MIPHKCPVCNGSGKVSLPSEVAGDVEVWTGTSCGPFTCNACKGAGVVWDDSVWSIPVEVRPQYTTVPELVTICGAR